MNTSDVIIRFDKEDGSQFTITIVGERRQKTFLLQFKPEDVLDYLVGFNEWPKVPNKEIEAERAVFAKQKQ